MILLVARLLHRGPSHAYLAQRVDCMYLFIRTCKEDLRSALERHGLALEHVEDAPHTSIGQPKHRLAVMSAPGRDAAH